MPDELMTYEDVAAELGCTTRHVRALVKAGKLATVRWGLGTVRPRRRVRRSELDRFLAAGDGSALVDRPRPRRLPPVPEYVT